jgi:hypothetical protein
MAISEVIYFLEQPFSRRNHDRFGIQNMEQKGFKVRIFQLCPYLYPEVHAQVTVTDPFEHNGIRSFYSAGELLTALSALSQSSFLILSIGYRHDTYPIFECIADHRIPYAVMSVNALPRPQLSKLQKLRYKIVNLKWGQIRTFISNKRIQRKKYLTKNSATLLLAGGSEDVERCRLPIGSDTDILWLHAFDYEVYMREKAVAPIGDRPVVFLDEYTPFHPDYIHLNINPYASAENYYPLLVNFFSLLEKRLGCETVIAAHPRSNYNEHPDFFQGRTVKRGPTSEMVQRSRFVIAHASTSVNFAVLYRKPVIFVTTAELEKHVFGDWIRAMAESLGKEVINLDDSFEKIKWEDLEQVDEKRYQSYQHRYIKTDGSEKRPFWDVVAERIRQI